VHAPDAFGAGDAYVSKFKMIKIAMMMHVFAIIVILIYAIPFPSKRGDLIPIIRPICYGLGIMGIIVLGVYGSEIIPALLSGSKFEIHQLKYRVTSEHSWFFWWEFLTCTLMPILMLVTAINRSLIAISIIAVAISAFFIWHMFDLIGHTIF